MRPTHYLRKYLDTGSVERLPFDQSQYKEAGLPFSPLAGVPELEAHQLVNKWNINQNTQTYLYALE